MSLELDPEYSVAFPCPQCDFVARGPGPLEEHMKEHNGVVVESVAAVSVNGGNDAVPVKRKPGRPPKAK